MITDYTIKYVNSFGDVLLLTDGANYAKYETLPAWELEAVLLNGRVAGLRNQKMTYTLPVTILGEGTAEGVAARNDLYEIPARDVDASAPGRLYFNDWYIEGYMTASSVTNFWQSKRYAQYELTFTATEARWVRDTTSNYVDQQGQSVSGLDFPFDFPFDFGMSTNDKSVTNGNYTESPIMLRIYGPATNPSVTIANNNYRLNISVGVGEYVEVDGMAYTVTHIKANGERVNAFGNIVGDFERDSGSYIFQPIPAGDSAVSWSGNFNFDIVTHELRSEPKWS